MQDNPFQDDDCINNANVIAQLQSWLVDLTPDNFQQTLELILHSNFVKSSESLHQLARNAFLAGECRPFSIAILCDFCSALSKALAENKTLSGMKSFFLKLLSMPPTRHSAHLFILRQLMYRNIISPKDIIDELHRFLNDHPDRIEDMLSTFCVFAPEIENLDRPLFDSILKQFKQMCEGLSLPLELRLFIDEIEALRARDWRLLIQRADFGFNTDPIAVAIKNDDTEQLKELASSPYFDKNQKIPPSVFERCMFLWTEPTLLQFAAFHGAKNCFNYLCEIGSGFDIKAKDLNLNVACFAVAGGHKEIIKLINEKDECFDGTLQVAALMHQHNIFHWLLDTKFKTKLSYIDPDFGSVLHTSAASNNTRLMLYCIAKNIDVNLPDSTGLTPLHIATEKSRLDSIRILLSHKDIEVNSRDENDETPLHVAAHSGRYMAIELLSKHPKIDINPKDKYNRTPLHFGAQEGYSMSIRIILSQPGVNVNARDDDNATPLHFAAHNGRYDAIRILVNQPNIDVNARDNNGWAPLHFSAQNGHNQTTRLLLSHPNIEVNPQDKYGWAPIHFAIQEGYIDIVRIFVSNENFNANVQYQKGVLFLFIGLLYIQLFKQIDVTL